MKQFLLVLLFSSPVYLICCADNKALAGGVPVIWYPALSLGQMLEQALPSDSKAQLVMQLSANWYDSFDLHNPISNSHKKSIRNCQAFFSALQEGLQPVNPADQLPYMELGMMCHATRTVAQAGNATISYLGDFTLNKSIVDVFPPQLAGDSGVTRREKILSDNTIKSWADAAKIKSVWVHDPTKVIVALEGGSQEIDLIAKGDFNADKIADILVLLRNSTDEGTHGSVQLFALTKKQKSKYFELLSEYSIY